jgi:tetratricopeptide (TPR) repeat protein
MRATWAAAAVWLLAGPCRANGVDLFNAAKAAEQADDKKTEAEDYAQALNSGDLTPELAAWAYVRLGGIDAFYGRNESAIANFSKAIASNPQLIAAYSLRGYVYALDGAWTAAEKDHATALALAEQQKALSDETHVLAHYADYWRRRRNYEKALECCRLSLEMKSTSNGFLRRAWTYMDMGDGERAAADYARFEEARAREHHALGRFWPDEREAIARLMKLPKP